MPFLQKQGCIIIPLLLMGGNAFASVSETKNPSTGLKSWVLQQGDFKLELIQRLPDQTRAFFQGRGFSSKIANDLALSCIFQAIGTNTGKLEQAEPVSYSLKDWQIKINNKIQPVKSKEIWKAQWSPSEVSTAARIAFTWSTFPTQQAFTGAGDYGWGMVSFGLPPNAVFDLKVVWQQNKKTNSSWVRAITCPPDK